MTTVEQPLLRATRVIHSPLVDSRGEKLGRVDDLIVRLADAGYPPVIGLKANIGGRQLLVPADRVGSLGPGRVQLSGDTLDLKRFERRPGEVLLHEDILDRRLIDVAGGRLVHANDIELGRVGGWWRLVGVDPTRRGLLARLLPAGRGAPARPSTLLDWSDVEPFVGHVPSARLLLPLRRLKRLHPAQIADIVEGASHDQGEEILTAVEEDPELEADVFEELDTHHQVEFLEDRPNQEAAEILGEMAPDDAADLITELEQDRRQPILDLMPAEQQRKVRGLLAYHPETAGGLMSPDLITVSIEATVAGALEAVRISSDDLPWQAASMVFVIEGDGRLQGSISVVDLLRAAPDRPLRDLLRQEPKPPHLHVDEGLEQVALIMADFNLTAAAVVERADRRVVGVVTADDLIEAIIPREWRRRQSAEAED
jgi:CBS domain-containing protein